jgi:hypothetical protein
VCGAVAGVSVLFQRPMSIVRGYLIRFFDFFRLSVLRSKTKRWTEKCRT